MPILGCPEHQTWISISEGQKNKITSVRYHVRPKIKTHKVFSEHLNEIMRCLYSSSFKKKKCNLKRNLVAKENVKQFNLITTPGISSQAQFSKL